MSLASLQLGSAPSINTPPMTVRETTCSTLIHRLSYGSSTGYTANMFKGCTHGCAYCYAPSLTHDERKWGRYVDVKVNAPQVLARELRGLRKDEVFLSSASDPYQPVEAKYKVTGGCLEVLLKQGFPVSILTRSPLVLRDTDILRRFEWVKVGMSITTAPYRGLEPGVPPLARRIDTLRKLLRAGIQTWVSLTPVIPSIMMVDFDRLFEDLSEAGVSSVSFGVLRFAGYAESKKMFEEAAQMTAGEALAGRDAVVSALAKLIRRHGMQSPDTSSTWKPGFENQSLDAFS